MHLVQEGPECCTTLFAVIVSGTRITVFLDCAVVFQWNLPSENVRVRCKKRAKDERTERIRERDGNLRMSMREKARKWARCDGLSVTVWKLR